MKLHTRILTVLADDIAALNAEDITIVLSPHVGMCSEDFNELKTIMAERHPTFRLRPLSRCPGGACADFAPA